MNEFISTIFNWMSSMYDQDWDNFLYDQGYYTYLGIVFLAVSIITAAIFYFANTVKFAGRTKWFIFMLISAVLIFAINFGISDYWASIATEEELPVTDVMDEIGTSFISAIWGIVTYVAISFLPMTFLSNHNYKVPFKA